MCGHILICDDLAVNVRCVSPLIVPYPDVFRPIQCVTLLEKQQAGCEKDESRVQSDAKPSACTLSLGGMCLVETDGTIRAEHA